MNLDDYQERSKITDQNPAATGSAAHIVPLGLVGELGSIASVWKKKNRDKEAYTDFETGMIEEIGDALWYAAALASRLGIRFRETYASKSTSKLNFDSLAPVILDLQHLASALLPTSVHQSTTEPQSMDKDQVVHDLLSRMEMLSAFFGKSLNEIAEQNYAKTRARWLLEAKSAAYFDSDFPVEEQLPRKLTIHFHEKKVGNKAIVLMRVNDLNIGDRITDNANEPDGYRFHDVFHWAYAAVLGWSPVIRALLRAKRKSDPRIDEVQDGARAQIVEEAISIQVFNYASGHSMLASLGRIDHDLLISITKMTKGLEAERCSAQEWERAILQGYAVFRKLCEKSGGSIQIDMDQRTIEYLD